MTGTTDRAARGRTMVALGSSAALVAAFFAGCGGDGATTFTSGTGGTGGTGGAGVGGGEGGQGGEQLNCVIDGVVSETEECDDNNMVSGDGCEPDCSWTCTQGTNKGDEVCDDLDPCNGVETCAEDHSCDPGQPAAEGTSCGMNLICKGGVCGDDVCGDMFVSAGEDCDDGNVTDGDGCDNDCSFSCESSDPNACTPADPCEGQGTCDDATHTCSAGTPLADGTACGANSFCQSGVCTMASCPNGITEPGEDCDDNNLTDGDGCDGDCTFSCSTPANDCPSPSVCNQAQCNGMNICEEVADPAQNGMACGSNLVCNNGACIAPTAQCGNAIVEMGEDCDFGSANNGPGTGCENNCTFSCTKAPDSCPDANACNGVESCQDVTVNGQTGQACAAGTMLANCSTCAGGLCQNGACQASTCGDGCVDANQNEDCEPPGTMTCSAQCTTIACGNGVREAGEQCDDNNTSNNDGCDSSCKFEQVERINWLKMQWNTEPYCPNNQLGAAITGGTAKNQLQQGLDDGVADGSINIITKALGLDDLTGTSDPMMALGIVGGSPETMIGPPYDGTMDLDWWYDIDPLSVDTNGVPTAQLNGSIASKVLNAGPGSLEIALILSGSPATLDMSNVTIQVTTGSTSTPLTSTGAPPGHEANENLDPALVSYQSSGQKTNNGSGKLCGRVSAASLAQVPAPDALTGGGLLSCSQNYSANNSLLDVIIGGCNVLFIQQITPTQPDTNDPTVPPAGSGPSYTLTANGSTKVVNGCVDSNNNSVPLAACLADAAYSAYFKFATGRVILK